MIKLEYTLENGLGLEASTNTKEILGFIVHLIEQERNEPNGVIASVLKGLALYHATHDAFNGVQLDESVCEATRDLMVARINADLKGVIQNEKLADTAAQH